MSHKYSMDSYETGRVEMFPKQACQTDARFRKDHVDLCDIGHEITDKFKETAAYSIKKSKIPGWKLATGLIWPGSENTFLDRIGRIYREKFYIVYDDIWEKVLLICLLIGIAILIVEFTASQVKSEPLDKVMQHIGWKIFSTTIKAIPGIVAAWRMFKRSTITSKQYLRNEKVKKGFFNETLKNLTDFVSSKKQSVNHAPDLVPKNTYTTAKKSTFMPKIRASPGIIPDALQDSEYRGPTDDAISGYWNPQ